MRRKRDLLPQQLPADLEAERVEHATMAALIRAARDTTERRLPMPVLDAILLGNWRSEL